MITQLGVVNDCLATMGEAPLNTLQEEHTYKAGALSILTYENRRVQATGWWFNMENAKLTTNLDGRIYLPSDTLSVAVMGQRPNIVQRGRVLRDLSKGTDIFAEGTTVDARLIREVPFESVPITAASYIAALAVLRFQSSYDGDSTKTRMLLAGIPDLLNDAKQEHIRNRRYNVLEGNPRLSKIRNAVNG